MYCCNIAAWQIFPYSWMISGRTEKFEKLRFDLGVPPRAILNQILMVVFSKVKKVQ
jgi:hypothetical protein